MGSERHQLSHLRADARWCEFREVATNRIPGSHTIRVYECACGIPLRMIDQDEHAAPLSGETEGVSTAGASGPGGSAAGDRESPSGS